MQSDARFYNGVSSRAFDVNAILSDDKKIILEIPDEHPFEIPLSEAEIVHHEKELLIISYGKQPRRILELRDPDFISACYNAFPQKSVYHRLLNAKRSTHISIAAGVIALIIFSYFFVLPIAAESAAGYLPQSFADKLGSEVFQQMEKSEDFKIDTIASSLADNYAAEMYPEKKHFFKVVVVKEEEYNAFALPDGHIVIYSGLLKNMQDETQLAGLLAHEMSHVEYRHTMRMMCKNMAGFLLLSLLLNDINGIMTVLLENANTLQQLSFSRAYEKEADLRGFQLLKKQKINPHGMTGLFTVLKKKEGKTVVPGFISTHPVTDERINYLKKEINNDAYSYTEHPKLKTLFSEIKTQITTYKE